MVNGTGNRPQLQSGAVMATKNKRNGEITRSYTVAGQGRQSIRCYHRHRTLAAARACRERMAWSVGYGSNSAIVKLTEEVLR